MSKKYNVPVPHAGVLLGGLVLVSVLGWYSGAGQTFYTTGLQMASVFFVDSSTPDNLHLAYNTARTGGEKLKVLIVPGHDNEASGTSFGGLSEADLNLALGKKVVQMFAADPNLEVRLARTSAGYDPELATYFVEHRQDILAYRSAHLAQMQNYIASGTVQSNIIVDHNTAPAEVAIRLYGINKWANEHGYDLIIHIHFNDIPRANRAKAGPYTGFAMYVPERQYSNAKGSLAVAKAIKARLLNFFALSTLPAESAGPTEDQGLIATGSNNSVDAASILIEYAYIYEPMVQKSSLREGALASMALQTYLGVEDFFNNTGIYATVVK